MKPEERLRQVLTLNEAAEKLAAVRIRSRYGPDLSHEELGLRLAALRIDRDLMIKAFNWDHAIEGL